MTSRGDLSPADRFWPDTHNRSPVGAPTHAQAPSRTSGCWHHAARARPEWLRCRWQPHDHIAALGRRASDDSARRAGVTAFVVADVDTTRSRRFANARVSVKPLNSTRSFAAGCLVSQVAHAVSRVGLDARWTPRSRTARHRASSRRRCPDCPDSGPGGTQWSNRNRSWSGDPRAATKGRVVAPAPRQPLRCRGGASAANHLTFTTSRRRGAVSSTA